MIWYVILLMSCIGSVWERSGNTLNDNRVCTSDSAAFWKCIVGWIRDVELDGVGIGSGISWYLEECLPISWVIQLGCLMNERDCFDTVGYVSNAFLSKSSPILLPVIWSIGRTLMNFKPRICSLNFCCSDSIRSSSNNQVVIRATIQLVILFCLLDVTTANFFRELMNADQVTISVFFLVQKSLKWPESPAWAGTVWQKLDLAACCVWFMEHSLLCYN